MCNGLEDTVFKFSEDAHKTSPNNRRLSDDTIIGLFKYLRIISTQ